MTNYQPGWPVHSIACIYRKNKITVITHALAGAGVAMVFVETPSKRDYLDHIHQFMHIK